MSLDHSVAGCLEGSIGQHGLSPDALAQRLDRLAPALARLRADYETGALPLLTVPDWTADLDAAKAALDGLMEGAKTLVFFGTGGSSLGGQALAQLGGWFIPGEQPPGQARRPRTRFYDNLDARTLASALDRLDLERSRFVIISKSGTTPETLAQCLAALQAVEAAGLKDRVGSLFLAVSEPAVTGRGNGLRAVCEARGIPVLDHPPDIGGRFSVLTTVGLLPALARGLDCARLRAGAREVIDALLAAAEPAEFDAAVGAAATIGLIEEHDIRAVVTMPYTDRLERFARWHAQLWSESLGKDGKGATALAALGPVDQHSQLQLFLDGPRQHLVTILRQTADEGGPAIAADLAREAGLGGLAGRGIGALVAAQQQAIPEALVQAGRPVRTIDFPRLDEQVLGKLLMHFMIETILAARLLGVDPFDQPAVEAGKVLTRNYLARST